MRSILRGLLISLFSFLYVGLASAEVPKEKKVALIIGNSTYAHAVPLPNPKNDAALIAATLKDAGFEVIEGIDLTKATMTETINRFTEAAYDANVAVVFYAGHGIQVDGQNYVIPVDAELTSPAHLRTRAVPVDEIMAALPPDPAVSVVILDACRDNPLSRTLAAALPKSRSLGQGLAPVETSAQSHGTGGTLIAYATDPGSVAMDGTEEHSPYTTALARNMTLPGLEIQGALTRVRAEVTEKTLGRQRPWHNASLGREVFLGGPAPKTETATGQPLIVGNPDGVQPKPGTVTNDWEVEQRLWDEASKRNTLAHYELYLKQYPDGRFASVAALNIDQLKAGEVKVASASPTDPDPAALTNPGSQVRTAVAIPEDVKKSAGTRETEEALKLSREDRSDIQLRLGALGLQTGGSDGSFGPRTRSAIGEWQRNSGIVETTYLTEQQRMFLSVQTDPLMAAIKADNERKAKSATVQKSSKSKKFQQAQRTKKQRTVGRRSNDRQLVGRAGGRDRGSRLDGAGAFIGGVVTGVVVCRVAGGC